MMTANGFQHRPRRRHRGAKGQAGSLLLETSIALGAAAMLALFLLKASLLAVTGNEWTSMQTLSDAVLTKETALANRMPFSEIVSDASLWPDAAGGLPADGQIVTLGKVMGGDAVTGTLIRFRVNQADASEPDVSLAVWRLHSILRYQVGEHEYVKSTSTLRVQ